MMKDQKRKAVFIDRDGVINKLVVIYGEKTSPKSLDQFEIFPYVAQATRRLRKDYLVIVITNQPDVARGKMSEQELKKMNRKLFKLVEIDDLYICTHDDADNCQCRKPRPGMILEAASKWNINLEKSIIIGDSWRDMLAGKRAGIRTCYINHWSNSDGVIEYDFEAKDLSDAVKKIYEIQGVF